MAVYNQSLTDTPSFSEGVVDHEPIQHIVFPENDWTFFEALTKNFTRAKSVTETLTITDLAQRTRLFSITETATLTDGVQKFSASSRLDALTIVELYTVVKSKGRSDFLNIFEMPCHVGVLKRTVSDTIAVSEFANCYSPSTDNPNNNPTFVGYNDMTVAQYNNLTADQYNNLLVTTPQDDVGVVNFPTILNLQVIEGMDFIEIFGELGGTVPCN